MNLSRIKKGHIRGIRFNTLEQLCLALRCQPGEMRTLAAQIPAELFDRLDCYLKERGIKKKDFLVDIITRALEEAEAAEPVTEASPQDELEEQPEADET